MKKMAWGFGLAAALALLAGQARAQSSGATGTGTSGTSSDTTGTNRGTSGSSGNTSDTSRDTSGSMGSGSTSSGASASTDQSTSSTSGHFDALSGKVQRFDRSKNELTLSGSDRKLKLDSTTKVMRDGARASIDDIKEGDQVRASFSGSGDTLEVKSLDITSEGATGSGAEPSKSEKKHSMPYGGGNAPSGNSGESSGSKSY